MHQVNIMRHDTDTLSFIHFSMEKSVSSTASVMVSESPDLTRGRREIPVPVCCTMYSCPSSSTVLTASPVSPDVELTTEAPSLVRGLVAVTVTEPDGGS